MDGVGTAVGTTGAEVVAPVPLIGASTSGSVMVVSWEVLMPETSKSELASGETDLLAGASPTAAEHGFFLAGCFGDSAAFSRGLFLGLPWREACLQGEGLPFFSGLVPGAGDFGDIWTLASSEPRTRRLVGVAVALIVGEKGAFWAASKSRRETCSEYSHKRKGIDDEKESAAANETRK
jgi:hypothetical protein